MGPSTSASYSRRCSSNHGLLLFSVSPERKRNSCAEKPWKRVPFICGSFEYLCYCIECGLFRGEITGWARLLSTDPLGIVLARLPILGTRELLTPFSGRLFLNGCVLMGCIFFRPGRSD